MLFDEKKKCIILEYPMTRSPKIESNAGRTDANVSTILLYSRLRSTIPPSTTPPLLVPWKNLSDMAGKVLTGGVHKFCLKFSNHFWLRATTAGETRKPSEQLLPAAGKLQGKRRWRPVEVPSNCITVDAGGEVQRRAWSGVLVIKLELRFEGFGIFEMILILRLVNLEKLKNNHFIKIYLK